MYHNIAGVSFTDELHKNTATIVNYLTDIKEMLVELDEHHHHDDSTISNECYEETMSDQDDMESDLVKTHSVEDDFCIYNQKEIVKH